ncbi:MAG: hypothetical protein ACYC91_17535 [Solirubrobacteraceae bacterium]
MAVIKGWSRALGRGDVSAAARYFAVPSRMINNGGSAAGASVISITSLAIARAANATLPCGAKFLTADQRGRFVNALFRLTDRPGPGGHSCGPGVGLTARTNFIITHGRILEWIRAPDDPGDNIRPGGGNQTPAPSGTGGSGPVA